MASGLGCGRVCKWMWPLQISPWEPLSKGRYFGSLASR